MPQSSRKSFEPNRTHTQNIQNNWMSKQERMNFIHFNRIHRTANQLASMFDRVFPSAVLFYMFIVLSAVCVVCVVCVLPYFCLVLFYFQFVYLHILYSFVLHVVYALESNIFFLFSYFVWHVSWPKWTWLLLSLPCISDKKKQSKTK